MPQPPPLPPTDALNAQNHPLPEVREVALAHLLQWLQRGWADTLEGGWLSFAHGLAVALVGAAMVFLAGERFWLLAGAFSGFLVVAPVLATSLYAISRAIEQREPVNTALVVKTWTRWQYSRYAVRGGYWSLVRFGVLLGLAGTGWVMCSAALITLWSPVPILKPADFFRHIVMVREVGLFEAWLVLGSLLAAPVFASSVVAIPMLVDKSVPVSMAVTASWRAVADHPGPLVWWAVLITMLVGLGMVTGLLGLIVVIPLIAHASWHAYRDLAAPRSPAPASAP